MDELTRAGLLFPGSQIVYMTPYTSYLEWYLETVSEKQNRSGREDGRCAIQLGQIDGSSSGVDINI